MNKNKKIKSNSNEKVSFTQGTLLKLGLIAFALSIIADAILFFVSGLPLTNDALIGVDISNIIGFIGLVCVTISLKAKNMKAPAVIGSALLAIVDLCWTFLVLSGSVTVGNGILYDYVASPLIAIALFAFPIGLIVLIVGIVMTKRDQ